MKVNIELELHIEMGAGSHYGTGLKGYLPEGTTYNQIIQVFGEPQMKSSPDGKIQVCWFGKINGLQFTIYDYKSSLNPQLNTHWHIGGKHKMVSEVVNAYCTNAINISKV